MIIPRLSQNKDNLGPSDHSKFARSRFIYWNIFYEFWHSPVESCSIQCTPWVRYSHIHSLIYALDVEVWTLSCYPHEKPLKPQQILHSALNLEVLKGKVDTSPGKFCTHGVHYLLGLDRSVQCKANLLTDLLKYHKVDNVKNKICDMYVLFFHHKNAEAHSHWPEFCNTCR